MSMYRYENNTNSSEYIELVNTNSEVMTKYSAVVASMSAFMILRAVVFFYYFARASIKVHSRVFSSIINADMTFFGKNLSGNIINRLSRDLGILDETLPNVVYSCLDVSTCRVKAYWSLIF